MENLSPANNPLATQKIGRLLTKYAIPSIISMLVNALYNIVDQIFIGQDVGMLGNAATNVAFPIATISTALALLIGVGTASNFNLAMGRGQKETAANLVGNGLTYLTLFGCALFVLVRLFLKPLLWAFGATEAVFPYALDYTGIVSLGLPFVMFSIGTSHTIRADGSPVYAMACNLAGAILNVILDAVFIFGLGLGIRGAAWATVISQVVSCLLAFYYVLHFKTFSIKPQYLKPQLKLFKRITSLGVASSANQLAMALVQVTLNNVLVFYGGASVYGSEIPLTVAGVITKVHIVYMSFIIGVAQGCQPLFGFNYGIKNYHRVKDTYKLAAVVCFIISVCAFLAFQLFPRQIISIFGDAGSGAPHSSELYFSFAEQYFRIFMFFTFVNGFQALTSSFFTSIGKASRGMFMALTRQVIFLLPLVLLLPRLFGIEGVLYAGPIADGAAFILAIVLVLNEMKKMGKQAVTPVSPPSAG